MKLAATVLLLAVAAVAVVSGPNVYITLCSPTTPSVFPTSSSLPPSPAPRPLGLYGPPGIQAMTNVIAFPLPHGSWKHVFTCR